MPAPSTTNSNQSVPADPTDNASVLSSGLRPVAAPVPDGSDQTGHDDSLLIEALVEVHRGRLALDELLEAGVSAQWAA